MTKKILCVFLCLILLSMAFPVSFLAEEKEDIPIDAVHFPDEYFRFFVADEEIDTDQDGFLSREEIAAVKDFYFPSKGIFDFTGIEYFTEIETFCCVTNWITELDVSNNKKLKILECNWNERLETLIVGENENLVKISAFMTKLKSIDVSGCPNLEELALYDTNLKDLDVTQNTKLRRIFLHGIDDLKEIDISNCPSLIHSYKEGIKISDAGIVDYYEEIVNGEQMAMFSVNTSCKVITEKRPKEEPSSKPVDVSKPTEVSSKPVDVSKPTEVSSKPVEVSKPTEVSSVPNEISSAYAEVSSEIEISSVEISSVSEISSAETEISSEATSFEEPASSVNGIQEQGSVWWWAAGGVLLVVACGVVAYLLIKK
ncbi:MAG: hypothetical protein IJC85_00965 [Oscillospiraceae bacterium]|nr:hypothetical protein [Oscillospiraceae bacterium]